MKNTFNKFLTSFLITLIVLLVLVLIFAMVPGLKGFLAKGVGKLTGQPEDQIYDNIEDIAERINQEIASGKDGEIELYVSNDVSKDDLTKVYYVVDSMKGEIKTITTYTYNYKDYKSVTFDFAKSDAMYAYESIVEHKSIPEDKYRARELEDVCRKFLDEKISSAMSDYDKELAVHDYIVENCEYGFSLKHDDSEFNAYGCLVNKKAVCSGYAAATNLLLMCCGVECKIVTGEARDIYAENSETERHAWNQVNVDGTWYNLDTTWDDPVGGKSMILHEYFNINDDIMDDTHTWDKKEFEKCDSMQANYYYMKGAYISDTTTLENYIGNEIQAQGAQDIEVALNGLTVNDDTLQFIFNYEGVNNISYSLTGASDYSILSVYINQ